MRLNGVDTFTTRTSDVQARNEAYGQPPDFPCPEDDSNCTIEVSQRTLRYEGERGILDYLTVQLAPFFRDTVLPIALQWRLPLWAGLSAIG